MNGRAAAEEGRKRGRRRRAFLSFNPAFAWLIKMSRQKRVVNVKWADLSLLSLRSSCHVGFEFPTAVKWEEHTLSFLSKRSLRSGSLPYNRNTFFSSSLSCWTYRQKWARIEHGEHFQKVLSLADNPRARPRRKQWAWRPHSSH